MLMTSPTACVSIFAAPPPLPVLAFGAAGFAALIFGGGGFSTAGSSFGTNFLYMATSLRAAKAFHQSLVSHLLTLPTAFFDTTPLGRILNRCSKDIYTIDERLQEVLYESCRWTDAAVMLLL